MPEDFYEFGPFRVDPARELLLRQGVAVPLTPKTFQILLVLVRHGKEIVTKDDLMKTVWPDTFVEEANLSRNIFMLRKALGESAQDHRYVVTVPGRGYRLAENVQFVPGHEIAISAASHSQVQIEINETRPWLWGVVAAFILLVAGLGLWRWTSSRRTALGAKDTVVLADFANTTGDSMFDEMLRQGLAIELRQSPYLSLISDQRISHTLRLAGYRADARLTPDLANAVCARTGSAAVLQGSIAPLGHQYVLTLEAKSCRTGEILDQEQAQARNKEDVLLALGQIAGRFRHRVGESLTTIQEHNTPLAEATTRSLEALEAYSMGWKLHTTSGSMSSLPFFKRAVEIDPDFALAHALLGRDYADLDESDLAAESVAKAWQLRGRTTDRERFFIAANYEGLATGNLERARQNDEAWARTYPRDPVPHSMLGGLPNKAAGQYEQALAEAEKAVEADPDFSIGYYNQGVNNLYLGRIEEAENVLRRAAARGIANDELLMLEHDIAFVKSDRNGMERAAARARQRSGGETWISNKEAFAAAYAGELRKANALTQRAVDQAVQEAQPERAALWEAGKSIREAFFGNVVAARKSATNARAQSNDREVAYGAALAWAICGDSSRAQTIVADLEKRFPEDSMVKFHYLPVLRAQIALNQGEASRAVEALQPAAAYELGASLSSFGALYPVFLRGEARLASGDGPQAVTEYQRILDHRGIVGSDPIGALAQLQIARALLLAGDKPRAKAAYNDFFTLWKEADPDIPVLKRAQAEYAKLN